MNPQDLINLIKKRRSIRKYSDKKIDQKIIIDLLEAARWAPSAGNRQPLEIIVINNQEIKEKLVNAALDQKFIADAPFVFVICANIERTASRYGERGSSLYCLQDTAASIQNILLLATANGLATCWIGAFEEEQVTDICKIPSNCRPIGIIPIAYPLSLEEKQAPPRKELDQLVFGNFYGEKFFL